MPESDIWETVIGLEVHAQIISESKLFSSASSDFGGFANSQVTSVDVAFPGVLPVINDFCIRQAIKTGLSLNAKVRKFSLFDRKHYFYADLPQGYQISQYHHPIIEDGWLSIGVDGEDRRINIIRVHLEQDAGKSLHDLFAGQTAIDLNRCGVALMEIVFAPDLRSSKEAVLALRKLRSILRYIGSCDGNMEEGSLRADVNVSVRRKQEGLGTRCEIKNLNSIKFVQQAIDFESLRQIELLKEGHRIEQQTRLFDTHTGQTYSMRSKEEAHDYRYFPDPDLPPLILSESLIDEVKSSIPELPDDKLRRFMDEYNLSLNSASILVEEQEVSDYFEKAAKSSDGLEVSKWIIGELFALLKERNISISQSPISPLAIRELVDLIKKGVISRRMAKEEVFIRMADSGLSASKVVAELGLSQIVDEDIIGAEIEKVLAKNKKQLAQYMSGKDKLFGYFVGQVMKSTKGAADPKLVNRLLKEKLSKH